MATINFLTFRIDTLEEDSLFQPVIKNFRGRSPIKTDQWFLSKEDAIAFAKSAIMSYYRGGCLSVEAI